MKRLEFVCESCSHPISVSDTYCPACGCAFDSDYRAVSYGREHHLTATEKKAILAILNQGLTEGRVGKKDYQLEKQKDGSYIVKIHEKNRGLVPTPGSPLRNSVRSVPIRVK